MSELNNSAQREINGRFLQAAGGNALNGGGNQWTKHDIVEIRAKYRSNLPELMEILFYIARNSTSERTQISAISELLDRLIGKPQVVCHGSPRSSRYVARNSNSRRREPIPALVGQAPPTAVTRGNAVI
jgi:hypothetical protein